MTIIEDTTSSKLLFRDDSARERMVRRISIKVSHKRHCAAPAKFRVVTRDEDLYEDPEILKDERHHGSQNDTLSSWKTAVYRITSPYKDLI